VIGCRWLVASGWQICERLASASAASADASKRRISVAVALCGCSRPMPSKFSKVIFGSCQIDFRTFRHANEKRLPGGEFFLELAQDPAQLFVDRARGIRPVMNLVAEWAAHQQPCLRIALLLMGWRAADSSMAPGDLGLSTAFSSFPSPVTHHRLYSAPGRRTSALLFRPSHCTPSTEHCFSAPRSTHRFFPRPSRALRTEHRALLLSSRHDSYGRSPVSPVGTRLLRHSRPSAAFYDSHGFFTRRYPCTAIIVPAASTIQSNTELLRPGT
jgi:hypothetical protein